MASPFTTCKNISFCCHIVYTKQCLRFVFHYKNVAVDFSLPKQILSLVNRVPPLPLKAHLAEVKLPVVQGTGRERAHRPACSRVQWHMKIQSLIKNIRKKFLHRFVIIIQRYFIVKLCINKHLCIKVKNNYSIN